MKIPYAKCDFAALRRENYFYVDKTPFLPLLEEVGADYLIFLRPRRFGKSTLLRTLALYYDIAATNEFDELFRGLWVHEHPTPEKNRYLVLPLDFSPVNSDGTTDEIRASFAMQVKLAVSTFVNRYLPWVPGLSALLPAVNSRTYDDAADLVSHLFHIVQHAQQQVYVLIDEYDHFGNRLLSDGQTDTYQDIVRSAGFVRSFYASLKAATSTSTLRRMFVTGVSPIMLDDLSSGFNIIRHISQDDRFNGLAGFTRADVERGLDIALQNVATHTSDPRMQDREALLAKLEEYYNGYRFAQDTTESMYNSTLVLYFLGQLSERGHLPRNMLDLNVRTDYGRLYAIAKAATGKPNGTRKLLEEVLTKGSVSVQLVEQFGTKVPMAKAQVASLFYYMGMLTFGPNAANEFVPTLVIPNRVMRELQWEYMSLALADHEHIAVDQSLVEEALVKMASDGDIQPLLDLFQQQVLGSLSNRDVRNFDERIMKLMLLAYLCQTQVFHVKSEVEMRQGYCDLLLGAREFPASKYAWILEAKYVKTNATSATIEKAVDEGYAQIEHYAADKPLVDLLTRGRTLLCGVLVFVGLKKLVYRPWPKPESEKKRAKKVASKKR